MYPYLVLFAYFAVGAAISSFSQGVRRAGPLWVSGIVLIILIGFRYRVGTDWPNYELLLKYARIAGHISLSGKTEPGYSLLNSIAAVSGWGLWFPNFICAVIFVYGLLVFCREQPNPWLALVVAVSYLVIDVAMGYTRQAAAVGLVLLALSQFSRGAHVRMFISIAFAATFHTSAVVIVPILAMAMATRGAITAIMTGFFAIALYFAFAERIGMLIVWYQQYTFNSAGAIPRILMNVFAAGIFLVAPRRFCENAEERRLWTIFSIVSFLLLPLLFFIQSTTVVDRVGVFLVPLQIFVLTRVPIVFGREGRQNGVLLLLVVSYSFAAEVVWLNYGNEARHWLPYRNSLWEFLVKPPA